MAALCAAGLTAAALVTVAAPALSASLRIDAPKLATIAAGNLTYWLPGEFTKDGKPVPGPRVTVNFDKPLVIMANQVTVAEYRRCAEEKACAPLADDKAAGDLPAVMVSWRDAQAYATWLSRKLGVRYRLPTDQEWTYAAGRRAPDESPVTVDANDPAQAWLSRYQRESNRASPDDEPKGAMPVGHFGRNENGLADIAGNVWEWTDTCFTRSSLDGGTPRVMTENCGVRIAAGRHRAYVSDFIRDARGGGCAGGLPPSNLGFRLVRESGWSLRLF